MLPFSLEKGGLTFRFEQLPDGGLRAWIDVLSPDLGPAINVGPVKLTEAETTELGALLTALTDLFARAHEREAPPSPEPPAERQPPKKRPASTAPRNMRPKKRPN